LTEMHTGCTQTTLPWMSPYGRLRSPLASAARLGLMFAIAVSVEVAFDRGRAHQLLDALRLVEALVEAEADVGGEFQIHLAGNDAAQIALVAFERGNHGLYVAPAERHHVDGRKSQVGAHAHLRHGDQVALEHGIVHLALRP